MSPVSEVMTKTQSDDSVEEAKQAVYAALQETGLALPDFAEFSKTDEYRKKHLFDRICIADYFLPMVQSKYRVVFEDPDAPAGAPCSILVPDPHWLAQALFGGILPPIEAELEDRATYQKYLDEGNDPLKFNWHDVGGAKHPYADPIGPMTEEQAIEYLIMKCLPTRVWADPTANYPRFKIVPIETIPTKRTFRNAWRINNE